MHDSVTTAVVTTNVSQNRWIERRDAQGVLSFRRSSVGSSSSSVPKNSKVSIVTTGYDGSIKKWRFCLDQPPDDGQVTAHSADTVMSERMVI